MEEHIPLIPSKGFQLSGSMCADVRSALRRVLPVALPPPDAPAPPLLPPFITHTADTSKGHLQMETCVFHKTAEHLRVARAMEAIAPAPPSEPSVASSASHERRACGCEMSICSCHLIHRSDVLPHIGSGDLWVQDALKSDDGDRVDNELMVTGKGMLPEPQLQAAISNEIISIGRKPKRVTQARPSAVTVSVKQAPKPTILILPPRIDFVNCTNGVQYTRVLRIINTGRSETRVSVSPPMRAELRVSLRGGLRVTSGAACALAVCCTTRDVRAFREELRVRVAGQGEWRVPIHCYTQPPILKISIGGSPFSEPGCESMTVLDLGARLLGDLHTMKLEFRCNAPHAAYWIMSEEDWLQWRVTPCGEGVTTVSDVFSVSPARWSGGGRRRGHVSCAAQYPGLQHAQLRILCTVATVRTLHLVADALLHGQNSVTIEASGKEYDICTEDDPATYYVHLEPTVNDISGARTELCIRNNSSVKYKFSWQSRPWQGWGESWRETGASDVAALGVTPVSGEMAPRSCTIVVLQVPPSDKTEGTHRAVIQLLLHEVPRESIQPELLGSIVEEKVVPAERVPGIPPRNRTLCSIVVGEVEVWWREHSLRLLLEPACLALGHSRRIQKIPISMKGTLIPNSVTAWRATHTSPSLFDVSLPAAEAPVKDLIVSYDAKGRCNATAELIRYSDPRHPAISPTFTWLGVVPPETDISADLVVTNDTHEQIYLWTQAVHWTGSPKDVDCIAGAEVKCPVCYQRECHCTTLRPRSTRLRIGGQAKLLFKTCGARCGPDVWLAVVRRSAGDEARPAQGPALHARAALVACRVLAPSLVLRVVADLAEEREPCHGRQKSGPCHSCSATLQQVPLDSTSGVLLRLAAAIGKGRRSRYRLQVKNLTPQTTMLCWEPSPDQNADIKITFYPNEIEVQGYNTVEMKIELEGMAVCNRKIWPRRGVVLNSTPVYLLVDAGCEGEAISLELPDGRTLLRSEVNLDPSTNVDTSEKNVKDLHLIYSELYLRRDNEFGVDDVCNCDDPEYCECATKRPQARFRKDAYCDCDEICICAPALQFTSLPVQTERSQEIRIHNTGPTCAWYKIRWTMPIGGARGATQPEGLRLVARPSAGCLPRGESQQIHISVTAQWGGPHRAIIHVLTDHCTLQLHVWVAAVGSPLRLLAFTEPPPCLDEHGDNVNTPDCVVWMSDADPVRRIRALNISGTELILRAYVVREHEEISYQLPFRLMYRMFDVPPPSPPPSPCLCDEFAIPPAPVYPETSTGIELFLASDYGYQDFDAFKVEPSITTLAPNATVSWRVEQGVPALSGQGHSLLVAVSTVARVWRMAHGASGAALLVALRRAYTERRLLLDPKCIDMEMCALKLPADDVMRIRKPLIIRNLSSTSRVPLVLKTSPPWRLVGVANVLELPPMASTEMYIEIEIETSAVWPGSSSCKCGADEATQTTLPLANEVVQESSEENAAMPKKSVSFEGNETETSKDTRPRCLCYPDRRYIKGTLTIHCDDQVLQKVSLSLLLRLPSIRTEPSTLSFGKVVINETASGYLTIHHDALYPLQVSVDLLTDDQFTLRPRRLRIPKGGEGRVYVRYKAGRSPISAKAEVVVRVGGDAGVWCRCSSYIKACVTRDMAAHRPVHNYTDDPYLFDLGASGDV